MFDSPAKRNASSINMIKERKIAAQMGTASTGKIFCIDPDTEEILQKNFSYVDAVREVLY